MRKIKHQQHDPEWYITRLCEQCRAWEPAMKSGLSILLFAVPLALSALAWAVLGRIAGAAAFGITLAIFAFNSAHIRVRKHASHNDRRSLPRKNGKAR